MLKFTHQKSCVLRQAACYGLGIFAENTPVRSVTPDLVLSWLQGLIEASKMAKGSEKEKTYGHCRDNAIASLGKVIKTQGGVAEGNMTVRPYIDVWLTFLPLKYDKPEAIVQHELLVIWFECRSISWCISQRWLLAILSQKWIESWQEC